MNRYMELAATLSRQSTMPKQVGALVVRGGRVLGVGFNREGSCRHTPSAWSRHAEVAAVLDAGDARGCTMYVYRGKLGPRIAKPCQSCQTLLKAVGIKKVYYSVNGGMDKMRL